MLKQMTDAPYQIRIGCASLKNRGVTIIELLVSISIISILMSLLLAGLFGAKNGAVRTHNIANLRECSLTIAGYSAQHDGLVPMPRAEKHYAKALWGGGSYPYFYGWDVLRSFWPTPIGDDAVGLSLRVRAVPWLYQEPDNNGTEAPAEPRDDGNPPLRGTSYWMGYGFLYEDITFTPDRPPEAWKQPALMRVRRTHHVAFPSQKGLLITRWALNASNIVGDPSSKPGSLLSVEGRDASYDAVFADGSIEGLIPSRSPPGYDLFEESGDPGFASPVLETAGGLAGIDR